MEFHIYQFTNCSYTPEIQLMICVVMNHACVAIEKQSHYNQLEQYYLNIRGPRGVQKVKQWYMKWNIFYLMHSKPI